MVIDFPIPSAAFAIIQERERLTDRNRPNIRESLQRCTIRPPSRLPRIQDSETLRYASGTKRLTSRRCGMRKPMRMVSCRWNLLRNGNRRSDASWRGPDRMSWREGDVRSSGLRMDDRWREGCVVMFVRRKDFDDRLWELWRGRSSTLYVVRTMRWRSGRGGVRMNRYVVSCDVYFYLWLYDSGGSFARCCYNLRWRRRRMNLRSGCLR